MIIKKISIENFQCYYGKSNSFEFTEGINLVLGNVNKGKSKLFDAFYWAFFGQIYITGEDWVDTNRLGVEFVNDKSKQEASTGDEITCSVEIILQSVIDDYLTDVTVKRQVRCKRISGSEWYNNEGWSTASSLIEVSYNDSVGNFILLDTQTDVRLTLGKLFPAEIKNYIWFQGEALDKLINFSDKQTFEQAIKHISYFPKYEKLEELITLSTEIISKEKNKKINSQTSNKREFEIKKRELDAKQRELEVAKADLAEIVRQGEEASGIIDETEQKLKVLHEFPPLHSKKINDERERDDAVKEIDGLVNRQKEQFQQLWMLHGITPILNECKDKLIQYDKEKRSGTKYSLPDDVPAKIFLEQMLKAKKCLVCDSDAPPDSKPYKFITDRIKIQEKYYKEQQENQEIFGAVNQIMSFPDELIMKLASVKEEIISYEVRIDGAIKRRNDAQQRVLETENEILNLSSRHKVNFSLGVTQASTLTSKVKAAYELKSSSKVKKERKEKAIAELEKVVQKLQEDLNRFIPNAAGIPEIKWYEVSNILKKVIESVKDKAKSELISKIEDKANQHYWNITKHNNAVDGKISIDHETYQITRTENDMYVIKSGNTGNYTLMKMCIISAMLSLNKEVSGDDDSYPFITDAPTSNFDDEMTIAYIQSLENTFQQSIIITKDINAHRLKQLKGNPAIKTIYELATECDQEVVLDEVNEFSRKLKQYEAYTINKRIK